MTILIIEDEMPAAERLIKLVKELKPEANIPDPLDSVKNRFNGLRSIPLLMSS